MKSEAIAVNILALLGKKRTLQAVRDAMCFNYVIRHLELKVVKLVQTMV